MSSSASFGRTIRSLQRGQRRTWLVVAGALAAMAGWTGWFLFARVPVYQASVSGRIESDAQADPIDAPVSGTVVADHLVVSRRVAAGEPLMELDASSLRVELDGVEKSVTALQDELASVDHGEEVERELIDEIAREGQLSVREAATSLRGMRADRDLAARERKRAEELAREGVSSQSDQERAAARSTSSQANLAALGVQVNRLRSSSRVQIAERRTRLVELEQHRAEVTGSLDGARASIARLQHEIERHVIRAPVAGTIGSIGRARLGSFLHEGDEVAVLVPEGRLRAVAMFPVAAGGRLAPGQRVVLRFPAYPWTAYGSRSGRVARVATEAHDEQLRVDIDVEDDPTSRIPLEHGQAVIAEVITIEVSPARLLLRNAGLLLDEPERGAR
jgi:multidrug resistance efflux pump